MKQYKYKVNGAQYDVTIDSIVGNIAKVEVNGIPFEVEMQGSSLVEEDLPTQVADETAAPAVAAAPAAVEAAPAAPAGAAGAVSVTAPMPGNILDVKVKAGDSVKAGDTLLILEAMKMENEISAPQDGTIASVNVRKGDVVNSGDLLITMN